MKNKKIKKSNSLAFLIIVLVGSLAVLLIAIYFNKGSDNSYNQSQISNNSNETKEYRSKDLKITINVPAKFKIEDRFFRLTLSSAEGNIYIEKSGTNFENIENYLDNLDRKNNSATLNKEKILVNNTPAISGLVGDKKYYFIYADKWVIITAFADSQALFDELDQIAQSFRYTPR